MRDLKQEYKNYKKKSNVDYEEWLEEQIKATEFISGLMGVAALAFLILLLAVAVWPDTFL